MYFSRKWRSENKHFLNIHSLVILSGLSKWSEFFYDAFCVYIYYFYCSYKPECIFSPHCRTVLSYLKGYYPFTCYSDLTKLLSIYFWRKTVKGIFNLFSCVHFHFVLGRVNNCSFKECYKIVFTDKYLRWPFLEILKVLNDK